MSGTVEPSDRPLRLIVMGTGPFAVPSFEALRAAGHEITLVVTKPQPPVKSRKGAPPSPVREWADSHQLPIYDPTSINEPEAVERIRQEGAQLLVVCDYGQILKPEALAAAALGGINLHGSLLPAYRGAAPVQWALLSGDAVTGVSVIHMTPRLDGGPVLCTRETPIDDQETAGQLEERLSRMGVGATLDAVEQLSRWDQSTPIGMPQDKTKVSKAPRLAKADGLIDWSRSTREIDCHLRGMQPWPVAFTFISTSDKKPPVRLAIKQGHAVTPAQTDQTSGKRVEPGEIVPGNGFFVATGDGVLEVTRLQPAGKKEMSGIEFLRGHQIPPGKRLLAAP